MLNSYLVPTSVGGPWWPPAAYSASALELLHMDLCGPIFHRPPPAEPCTALEIKKGKHWKFPVISCMKNNKFRKRFGASLRVGGMTTMCWVRRGIIPFDFQRASLAGLVPNSATSSGLGRASRSAPSRHHLELQDRQDYTPADRATRTCWQLDPEKHLNGWGSQRNDIERKVWDLVDPPENA
ncbi:hypothetical protein TNCV_81181 [Trichonephila clavipes]|nr:hypothetical protein TNCV_81181 [Trichonephila clavipes]